MSLIHYKVLSDRCLSACDNSASSYNFLLIITEDMLLLPVLEVSKKVRDVIRSVLACPVQKHLVLNELSQRHRSMTGLLQKARLCATTTKQGPCLCLGAGTAERACLDSECHRALYSQLECPVSSPFLGRTLSQCSNDKPQ